MISLTYLQRSLRARPTTTALTASAVALVVFVFSAAWMLQSGIRRTLGLSGSPRNAIVLRKGSPSEMASVVSEPAAAIVRASAAADPAGAGATPRTLSELVLVRYVERAGGGGGNVQIRGVPDGVAEFRPDVRIVEGRRARPGADEAIVGKAIRDRFKGLDIGQSFALQGSRSVQVVGVFESNGSSFESEVWSDLRTVQSASGRAGMVSTMRVRLDSPGELEALRAAVTADPRLGLDVVREDEFFDDQSSGTAAFVTAMGALIAIFASIGATVGTASSMYAAVSQRRREAGVLRALGFSRRAVLGSYIAESIVVSLIGASAGAALSLAVIPFKLSMMNTASFSQTVFELHPTAFSLVSSLGAGAAMGIVGGFLPALRGARMPSLEAMRS